MERVILIHSLCKKRTIDEKKMIKELIPFTIDELNAMAPYERARAKEHLEEWRDRSRKRDKSEIRNIKQRKHRFKQRIGKIFNPLLSTKCFSTGEYGLTLNEWLQPDGSINESITINYINYHKDFICIICDKEVIEGSNKRKKYCGSKCARIGHNKKSVERDHKKLLLKNFYKKICN